MAVVTSCARCRRYIISFSSCLSCSIVASHASPVPCLQAARIPCPLTPSPCHLHPVAHIKRARRALKTLDALFYECCYQLLEVIMTLHTPKLMTNDSNPRNSALGTRNSSIIQASGRTIRCLVQIMSLWPPIRQSCSSLEWYEWIVLKLLVSFNTWICGFGFAWLSGKRRIQKLGQFKVPLYLGPIIYHLRNWLSEISMWLHMIQLIIEYQWFKGLSSSIPKWEDSINN
jgi:hypothetical protein